MVGTLTARRVPVLVWIFLGLAAVDLAVHVALNWYQLFGPYLILRPEDVVRAVTAIGPFLLAAGVLAAAATWPAGRRRLQVGGILIGLHALQAGVTDLYFATLARDGTPLDAAAQTVWIVLAVGSSVALGAGMLLIADGLRVAGSPPVRRRGIRLVTFFVLAGLVVLATAATVGTVARESAIAASPPASWYVVAYRFISLLAVVGAGLTGIFALGVATPRAAAWPIAIGAALNVGGAAWFWGGSALLPIEVLSGEIALTSGVPLALGAVGVVLMAVGFGVAATLRRTDST